MVLKCLTATVVVISSIAVPGHIRAQEKAEIARSPLTEEIARR